MRSKSFYIDVEMNFEAAQAKCRSIGQEQLLRHWNSLSESDRSDLLKQVEALDGAALLFLRQQLVRSPQPLPTSLEPFRNAAQRGSSDDFLAGKQLIASGAVGCLVVAGGQGSRLRFEGPKGLFPVTLIKHKSLFQLLAEKVVAASRQCGRPLPLAIMTSPTNHQEAVQFFAAHRNFGLESGQLAFFSQAELPLLDPEGKLILETASKIATGADGNGTALQHFVEAGLWEQWQRQGVRFLNFILIDNPLADPFDAELIGFHQRQQADLVIKCVERFNPDEKVGMVVKQGEQVRVIEYSELPKEEREAVDRHGTLKHRCANISLFSLSMDFVKVAAAAEIPFHQALKAVKYLDEQGITRMASSPNSIKFEKFIFDLLPLAKKVRALLYPRQECFAPLKNATGPDSLEQVQAALQQYDRDIFAMISGREMAEQPFELSPQFYYPTPELLVRWRNRELPQESYIEDR
jgi:UDP-N-acetylglucosamine/UDP-N-acetylgalactosamine diphosphorylase